MGMPLTYVPNRSAIVMCDFTKFASPEMTKVRPGVVISRYLKNTALLCVVIPFSTTEPYPVMPYHTRVTINPPLPRYSDPNPWVKCDMIYTLSISRLDLPYFIDPDGKRVFVTQYLSATDMMNIERCIKYHLCFG